MTTKSDILYIEWLKTTTKNLKILQRLDNFDGIWARQFLFKLLYFHELDFLPKISKNIKVYLDII